VGVRDGELIATPNEPAANESPGLPDGEQLLIRWSHVPWIGCDDDVAHEAKPTTRMARDRFLAPAGIPQASSQFTEQGRNRCRADPDIRPEQSVDFATMDPTRPPTQQEGQERQRLGTSPDHPTGAEEATVTACSIGLEDEL
jgi:hypothetical protein